MGGVFLQQHMAHAHKLYFAVAVGVVGQHAHVAVVAGDKVLDDHRVRIAGGIDLIQHLLQVLPVGAGKDLLVALEGMLPVGHAVGGLADVGRLEIQLEVMPHLLAVDEGAGVVDAVLIAEGIELLLVDEGVDELPADRGGDAVFREILLVLGGQLHVAVAAADDQHGLVRKLLGGLCHVLAEGGSVLVLGADPVVDDGGPIGRAGGKLAIADRLDSISLVEGPCYAVNVNIPAEEQGLEVVFHS